MAARPATANLGDTLSWLRTYTPPFFKDRIGLRRSKLHAGFDARVPGLLLYFLQGLGENATAGLTPFVCRFSGSYRRIASRDAGSPSLHRPRRHPGDVVLDLPDIGIHRFEALGQFFQVFESGRTRRLAPERF